MYNEILCSVCGKEIQKQKVLMCADCKIAIKVEYEGIKKQAQSERMRERVQLLKYMLVDL
jgi:predicted amidophosphoribosyltransferase